MTATVAPTVNIASHLTVMAARSPGKDALVLTRRPRSGGPLVMERVSFAELERATDEVAHGLERVGIRRGTRTVVLVKPGRELFTLVFALFKVGAPLVLVDPGLGAKNALRCLEDTKPEALIAVPLAHAAKTVLGRLRTVKTRVTVGRRWFWGGARYKDLLGDARPYTPVPVRPEDPAAILFTSGSTGIPKGAVYEHGMFDAQVKAVGGTFGIQADEIDLPTFPLFALFDPALGMTAVIPDMDFTRPASVDPRNVIEPIQRLGITNLFGSPALLDTVSRGAGDAKLPSLRRVISAGAPVPPEVLQRFQAMLAPGAEIHTPYGATEALPVATIGSREVLDDTRRETAHGAGTCVGRPAGATEVRLVKITDEPIERWSPDLAVPPREAGEIVVRGPVVTREYANRPDQTALAKLRDGDAFWHRMGDLGRFDDQGRLWYLGRKSHRVVTEKGTFFTDACEGVFNQHPRVRRSALVGVGARPRQRAVVLVELHPGPVPPTLIAELRALAQASPVTGSLDTFVVYPRPFPVDIRHNAKIFREKLAVWAAEHLPS